MVLNAIEGIGLVEGGQNFAADHFGLRTTCPPIGTDLTLSTTVTSVFPAKVEFGTTDSKRPETVPVPEPEAPKLEIVGE